MEFHKKIQELRKQKGITQEELAAALYVSRTAISKWESGRGYPNIDSLKALSKYFGVTIDALLSGDELLTIAEEDTRQKKSLFCDLLFGLLDCSAGMFFFLPFFGQTADGVIQAVSLAALTEQPAWLRAVYTAVIAGIVVVGIGVLTLQHLKSPRWTRYKRGCSLVLNTVGVFLFIISRQPYAAAFLFIFLVIKAAILTKKQ